MALSTGSNTVTPFYFYEESRESIHNEVVGHNLIRFVTKVAMVDLDVP
jgi:hypothetical protein